ncbi:hypothetical protein [Embleya sp. NPDC020630]|uniref:hypothetical protein n=1 Tax=Embleya sp. NPDC020630 TaxID=3363979 RepID=UPI00379901C5
MRQVVREVADYLGNTPAVARASYIDPRVFHCDERGVTVAGSLTRLGDGIDFGDLATRGRWSARFYGCWTAPTEPGPRCVATSPSE